MDEGKKKAIMIAIVVVCFIVAGVIYLKTRSDSGLGSISEGQAKVWLKCRNPKCENEWEMDAKKYFVFMEKNRRGDMTKPPVPCPKCGDDSGYEAMKCEKCGAVFEENSVPNASSDKCPKCGHSPREERRKSYSKGGEKATEQE